LERQTVAWLLRARSVRRRNAAADPIISWRKSSVVQRNAISIAVHALHYLLGCIHMDYQPVTKFVLPTTPAKSIL
jgi:hypothetical protein